jgi:hypothetical protein
MDPQPPPEPTSGHVTEEGHCSGTADDTHGSQVGDGDIGINLDSLDFDKVENSSGKK